MKAATQKINSRRYNVVITRVYVLGSVLDVCGYLFKTIFIPTVTNESNVGGRHAIFAVSYINKEEKNTP